MKKQDPNIVYWKKQEKSLGYNQKNSKKKEMVHFTWILQESYPDLKGLMRAIFDFQEKTGCQDINFEFEQEYGYYNDVSVSLAFNGNRLETDEEFNLRQDDIITAEKEAKEASRVASKKAAEKEYETFLKLKKKYEKESSK